jgi:hypothetical protein
MTRRLLAAIAPCAPASHSPPPDLRERERDGSARDEVKASEQRAGETAASKERERNGVGRARVSEQRARGDGE